MDPEYTGRAASVQTTTAVAAAAPAQLAQGALGVTAIVYQGIIGAGPTIAIALNISLGAGLAGVGLPFMFVLGSLAVMCVAIIIAQFTRHLPAAGAYFAFASRGLGPIGGLLTGWVALLYGALYPAVPVMVLASLLPSYSKRLIGVEIPWYVWVIVLLVFVWYPAYTGIRRSTRVAIVTGTIELAIVAALIVAIIVRGGSSNTLTPFVPHILGFSGALSSLVFVFLSFSGFESVANLAEEAHQPRKNIGAAVIIAVAIMAVFYTASAYAGLLGFHFDVQALAGDPNPFDTLAQQIAGPLSALLAFAFLNSGLGGGLGGMLAAPRNLYAMGRAGMLPRVLARVHPRYQTPSVAVHLTLGVSLALGLGIGALYGPEEAFALIATIFTIAVLVMYLASAIALPIFYRREHADEFRWSWHILVPGVAAALIVAALVSLVYPVAPAAPISYAFPVAGGWLVIGIALAIFLRLRRPKVLAEAGRIFVPEEAA